MAAPISKIVKPLLEQPQEQLIKKVAQDTKFAKRKTGFESQKVKAKLEEVVDVDREVALKEKKRDLYLKMLRLKKEDELIDLVKTNKAKGVSARETIKNILSNEQGVGHSNINIEGRTTAIETRVGAKIHDLKESLRTKWSGLTQDSELGHEVIRFLKDGKVKNEKLTPIVTKIANQWKEGANQLKTLRNRAGGRIGELEDWIVPQSHDKIKIKNAGYEAWKEEILPKLDRARIEKEQGAKLEDILENAYTNITSRKLETPLGSKQLAKKQEFDRVLHFKDGEGIINYNLKYGNPDVFATMDSHVRSQANEIAQMQVLGPNPEKTYEGIKVLARNEGMGSIKETALDALWNVSTGKVDGDNVVDVVDNYFAAASGTYRAIQIASKLGSATISALADISNIMVGGGYRGVSGIKIMGKGLNTLIQDAFSPGKVGKNIEIAARLGVVSEFANASLTNTRYAEMGTGFFQRRAENVIRASGLGAWTNALRVSFGLEVVGSFAENAGKTFDNIPFRGMLDEYGITAKDWDTIRKTKPKTIKKAKFMDVEEIYKADEELGYKVSNMLNNEMNAFVVAPGYRARVFTTWGKEKGTLAGEAARNMMLFKSFPVSVTMMHLNRMGTMSKGGKTAYTAGVMTTGVVFGTMALYAHDVVTGKTPRKLDRWQMIPEAILKSGGLGMFGDMFLGEQKTRYGHSWTGQLVGVPQSTIEDIGGTLADTYKAAVGEQSPQKSIANTYNRAKNYIPGQNLWYTRLGIEQTMGRVIGEMIDPDYHKKIRRRKKALRTRGQELIFP
jgi:hypothetical protein